RRSCPRVVLPPDSGHYSWGAMRRFLLPGLVAAAAVALVALLVFGIESEGVSGSLDAALAKGVQMPAPDANVALPVLGSGKTETLAELKGKVVVLNLFASWCDPCKAEARILKQVQRDIHGHDATVLGVTYLDTTTDSEHFVRQEHINYPVVRDVSGNFARAWGANGIPETFVIDRAGRVVALRRYQLAGNWLAQSVNRVLSQSS
ncbi:MAG TPA: TlpA disulfide reductase family protein, partial [Solirubrobacteraceae bacterium]|nr:TlpA disulfide reductase family protein [Solirubrobacteraceae bacterium]